MLYFITSILSINKKNLQYLRALYNPNPIFIPDHVSLHKQRFCPYQLHWKYNTFSWSFELILCDKKWPCHDNQRHNGWFQRIWKYLICDFKESVKNIISDQDTKLDRKPETQLQPLSLQVKENTSKLGEQGKLIYSFTKTYNERLDNMSTNTKISTKFGIEKNNLKRN